MSSSRSWMAARGVSFGCWLCGEVCSVCSALFGDFVSLHFKRTSANDAAWRRSPRSAKGKESVPIDLLDATIANSCTHLDVRNAQVPHAPLKTVDGW